MILNLFEIKSMSNEELSDFMFLLYNSGYYDGMMNKNDYKSAYDRSCEVVEKKYGKKDE